jgi:ribonuclease D
MADTSVVKVFHAARQDIEIMVHRGDLVPHPIFDTQVAAMVCGFGESISYDQLVSRITGAHIDKSSRFTDWSRRPLSEKQLDYALADVTHLRDIYLELLSRLKTEGRNHWVADEMAVLESRARPMRWIRLMTWRRLKMRVRKPIELVCPAACGRLARARGKGPQRAARRMIKDDASTKWHSSSRSMPKRFPGCSTVPRGWERSASGCETDRDCQRGACNAKGRHAAPATPRQAPEGAQAARSNCCGCCSS